MQVSIRAVDFVLTLPMRATVEEKLAFALAWTGRQTVRLGVLLSNVAGPGGKVLKCCKIQALLSDGRRIVVEDIRVDLQMAAERAANRIDRLLRHARRRHETKRSTESNYQQGEKHAAHDPG